MDLFEAIEKRSSIRKFLPDIPPREDIEKILNAARLAPSSHNDQMWKFIVITNKDILNQLREAVVQKYEEVKQLPEAADKQSQLEASKKHSAFFTNAPVVIAVLMHPTTNVSEQVLTSHGVDNNLLVRMRPHPDSQSIGAAIEHILLASTAMGYGACWMTAPIIAYVQMEQILDVQSPYQLGAIIPMGKPLYPDPKKTPRKLLDELVTYMD